MKNLIIMPDGSEISSGPGMKTAIKRMTITEMVNDKDDLSLGSACANSVEVSILAPEGLAITAGDEIALYRVDGDNRIPNGVYIVENPTQVSAYTVKLTAYDRIVKLDKDLTQWLAGLDAWPYTLLDFARMVCEECGLELVTDGWIPNAYFPVRKFAKSGVTGRKLMRWIGEVFARFVRATADGKIEFAWYAPTGVTIAPTGGNYYFSGSFSKEKYAVATIDSVHIRFANSEAGYLWPELEDASANIYAISDNPFLSSISEDTSDDISEALELIRDELEGVTYTPCKVSVPASYGIKAGQIVDLLSKDGTAITTYVMKSTTRGQRTSLECTGSARRDSTTAVNNKTPAEAAKYVLLGETPQEVFDRLTGMSKDQGIYMEDGKIYINAEYIKAGTLRADEMKLVDGEETLYFMTWDEVNAFVEQTAEAMSLDTLKTYGCTVDDEPINGYGVIQIAVGKDADSFRSAVVLLTADDAQMVRNGWAEGNDGVLYWSEWKTFGGADAVVEQGTSGIWKYQKWNSGKIELWTESISHTVSYGTISNYLYFSSFTVTVPLVTSVTYANIQETDWHYAQWTTTTRNSTNQIVCRYYSANTNGSGETYTFMAHVIGTWK